LNLPKSDYDFSRVTQGGVIAWGYAWEAISLNAIDQTLEILSKKSREYRNWYREHEGKLKGLADEIQLYEEIRDTPSLNREKTNGQDGLVRAELVPHPEMRALRDSVRLQSAIGSELGGEVRKALNRSLILTPENATQSSLEGARLSASLALAADQATADGQRANAQQLINASLTTLDLALGFIPVISSINDASQIMFGMVTGYDYTGNKMANGDYALRGAGIVLGLLPVANGVLRFGRLAITRASLFLARASRMLPAEATLQAIRSAAPLLHNSVGAVGLGVAKYVRYQTHFGGDLLRFQHMMAGLKPFNSVMLKVSRELSKHPEIAGFATDEALRAAYRTEQSRAVLAEERLYDIIKNGVREQGWSKFERMDTWDYRLPDGRGARFFKETGEMVGFL
jgi:hypothetical protein